MYALVKLFNWYINWGVRCWALLWKELGSPFKKGLKEVDLDPSRVLKK